MNKENSKIHEVEVDVFILKNNELVNVFDNVPKTKIISSEHNKINKGGGIKLFLMITKGS